ncbi:MAG TPA: SCO family protein [Pirellulales bacterium]|nr:SCO family protein [Pirellulales bacterium]
MSNLLKGWLTLLLALLAAYGSYTIWRVSSKAAALTGGDEPQRAEATSVATKPARRLEELKLVERDGKPFDMRRLEGRVWVASTFFASCPGFCLTMNQKVAAIAKELADTDVTFVSVTVDPANDTPKVLADYANDRGADPHRWLFLTGDLDDIHDLCEAHLKLPSAKSHSDKLVLIGRDGRFIRGYTYSDSRQLDSLLAKVRELQSESAPGKEAP